MKRNVYTAVVVIMAAVQLNPTKINMKTYTIEQFRNYLLSQDSMGNILYNLKEEKIDHANKRWVVYVHPESDCVLIDTLDNEELCLDELDELERFFEKDVAIEWAKDYANSTGLVFHSNITAEEEDMKNGHPYPAHETWEDTSEG